MKVIKVFKFLIYFALIMQTSFSLANSVQINESDLKSIMEPEQILYKEKQENSSLLYISKQEETPKEINSPTQQSNDKTVSLIKKNNQKDVEKPKKEKKIEDNIITSDVQDRILSESTRNINAIYPIDEEIVQNQYPGYRGANQLVIYTRDFGRTTGTNEFGKEAVVVDGIVTKLTGANSNIPKNGYVISGHGSAKKWISDNIKIGTKIEIIDRQIKAYTTIDSYRFFAESKINEVESALISLNSNNANKNDKYAYYYLKKAKQQLKKSDKDNSDASLYCAKEAIESASIAYRYTLPYISNELKGTWVRPTQNSVAEVSAILDKMKSVGLNNVFLETYFHGKTIFPSQTMNEYGFEKQNPNFDFDVLAAWVTEAHKRGMKVHTWFESFYIGNQSPELNPQSILAVKPTWQNRTKQKADYNGYVSHPNEHNGYFLDPANPEVINFTLKLIKEIVTKYDVDGVNLDYVRYPNIAKENYNNQWGYTPYAREEFKQLYNIDPIDIEPKTSEWNDWCEYRQDKITSYIQKASAIIKSKNKIASAVVFPDYKVSLQTKHQDWVRWVNKSYLDAITPLILTSDDNLAKSMLEEIKRKTNDNANVYPGLFAGFIESDPEDLLKQIHIIRKLKLEGVILFDWAHLNNKYIEVLKTCVFKEQTY